jgi:tetratricopeptide (TPR) repeat protein
MHNKYNALFKEIFKSILENQTEKVEYLILHYLENEPHEGKILLSEYLSNIKKDHEISKKILYKLILKNKHDLQLRLRYISILLKNKEYTKAIKWCEKALHMANKSQKKEIYYILAQIFYQLNRPERAIQYINLCLKIDEDYTPAKYLQNFILKNLYYEPHH